MKRKFTIFTILALFVSSLNLFAQENNSFNFRFFEKPFIEVDNGISKLSLDGYKGSFSNAGIVEVKLGSATQFKSRYGKDVLKYFNSFVFLNKTYETYNYNSSKSPGS